MRKFAIIVFALALATPGAHAAGVVFELAADVVGPEDQVVLHVTNETPLTIQFGSSAPYVVKNLDTGAIIPFVGLAVMIPLLSGDDTEFVIEASDLGPGHFEVTLGWYDKDYEQHVASARFEVQQGDAQTPTELDSIGRLKAGFRD